MDKKVNIKDIVLPVLKTVLAVSIVTGVLLVIFAFLLYKFRFGDKVVDGGIITIYFLANLVGGLIIGKAKEQRKFIWGLVVGLTYFFILSVISFMVTGVFFANGVPAIVALLACSIGGTLGGMLS